VTKLFRHPVLGAFSLMIFPVISTLLFRPVFANLAIGSSEAIVPQRMLTVFTWCRYGAFVVPICGYGSLATHNPICFFFGLLIHLARHRMNRFARFA
jgi:hypothetical protein